MQDSYQKNHFQSFLEKPLNIVADENIPCLKELFEPFGRVKALPGRSMTESDLAGADILLVRSVTKVNESLLAQSKVRFVGTCTIGVDHLDQAYLQDQGISYSSAPGCNAGGVVQYALSAMAHLREEWRSQRIGIIGCGNVGGRLYRQLKKLGVNVCTYDPFLSPSECPDLTTFEEVLACDIICMHTPLTKSGPHPTHHLLNVDAIAAIKPGSFLLNAGRGDVIDNHALLKRLESENDLTVVLDVWENEPRVLLPLVPHVAIASPHIAGYSFEGRLNGSTMIYDAFVEYLKKNAMGNGFNVDLDHIENHKQHIRSCVLGEAKTLSHCDDGEMTLNSAIRKTYPILDDDARFREAMVSEDPVAEFDRLRKTYWQRREFPHYRVSSSAIELSALESCDFVCDSSYGSDVNAVVQK